VQQFSNNLNNLDLKQNLIYDTGDVILHAYHNGGKHYLKALNKVTRSINFKKKLFIYL
jgi:hypothetical protein